MHILHGYPPVTDGLILALKEVLECEFELIMPLPANPKRQFRYATKTGLGRRT